MIWILMGLAGLAVAGAFLFLRQLRRRGLDRCLVPYIVHLRKRRCRLPGQPTDVLLCVADHFEPGWGRAAGGVAQSRVERWVAEFPSRFGALRDSDGRPPRWTFFYPLEEYVPSQLEALTELCRAGFGEVEVHLHHDGDTAENLRAVLVEYRELLARRHGLLSRHRQTGEVRFGFVHGNWALDNSRPDGRWCGVNNELAVLRETGCYADFTLPSAPSPTQTRKINSIYYARGNPNRTRSHDAGPDVGTVKPPADALLLIQGPLLLDWSRRKWGIVPRLENGCLQANQAPSQNRLATWLKARIQVASRPDWFFVKLHTHGAKEPNADMLLGEPMLKFHRLLAEMSKEDVQFRFHYVTAREMYNLVRAAEAGWQGSVADALDFELIWNGGHPQAGQVEAGHSGRVDPPT